MESTLKYYFKNKVSIELPDVFQPMSQEDIEATYPIAAKRPKIVLSTEDQGVTFAINHTTDALRPVQLPSYKVEVFERQFTQPNIKLISSEIKDINGRDFIVLDFVMPVGQNQLYTMLLITSLENRMLIGAFNCPEPILSSWQQVSAQLINSLKIL